LPIKTTIRDKEVELQDSERQPCEVWSRVMGYFRPVINWNIGKKAEHKDRVYYKEATGSNSENKSIRFIHAKHLERDAIKEVS
jgi:hypothetical protein